MPRAWMPLPRRRIIRRALITTLMVLTSAVATPATVGAAGTTTQVNVSSTEVPADAESPYDPSALSGNGQYVAFMSIATNLVRGDTNGHADIFMRSQTAGLTMRVSVSTNGAQANGYSYAPTISADGRFVAFASVATNLVAGDTNGLADIFVRSGWR